MFLNCSIFLKHHMKLYLYSCCEEMMKCFLPYWKNILTATLLLTKVFYTSVAVKWKWQQNDQDICISKVLANVTFLWLNFSNVAGKGDILLTETFWVVQFGTWNSYDILCCETISNNM